MQTPCPARARPRAPTPGTEARYELSVASSAPVELLPLQPAACAAVEGAWGGGSAGGCDLHATWTTNPAFWLAPPRAPCTLRCVHRPATRGVGAARPGLGRRLLPWHAASRWPARGDAEGS